METVKYKLNEDYIGMRIDKVLPELIEDITRSKVKTMIKDGHVLVNDICIKSNYICKNDDEVTVFFAEPEPLSIQPENIPLDIYYEDDDVLVVNKPSGMVVHPAPQNTNGTLVNALLYHVNSLSSVNGYVRPGIVHRIDKDTSGLLVVAKNDVAHNKLAQQLKDKTVKREYVALVHGNIGHERGTIDAPIGRDPKDRTKNIVISGGRDSITHFQVFELFHNFTLVKCILETGRTHQIRVHMKYINYPLVGDPKYGPQKVVGDKGQYLHAKTLGFIHPTTNEYIEFEAPLPKYFEDYINKLRNEKEK